MNDRMTTGSCDSKTVLQSHVRRFRGFKSASGTGQPASWKTRAASRRRPPSGSAACASVLAKLLDALVLVISDGPAFAAGAAADGAVETSPLDSGPVAAAISALPGRAGSARSRTSEAPSL